MSTPTGRTAAWLLLLAASGAAVVLCLSFVVPPEAMAAGEPLASLGLRPPPCPGCVLCGMSRAFACASRGEVGRALAFHPGVAVLYPAAWLLAVAGFAGSSRLIRSRRS